MAAPPTDLLEAALARVDEHARAAFEAQLAALSAHVHRLVVARADLPELLGLYPRDALAAVYREQGADIASHLRGGGAAALIETVVAAYRAQLGAGIAPRFLPISLASWMEAVSSLLPEPVARPISAVCSGLLDVHWWLLLLAHTPHGELAMAAELAPYYQRYLQALLKPDAAEAIRVAREYITDVSRIPVWWEQIIQPAMYEVGNLWASGRLSVGQEQLATSITQRVMANFYPLILNLPRDRGAVVVTASPGELHEIGPRILADLLEMNGWDVHYLGANSSLAMTIALIQELRARFLCISTTLVSSIPAVADIIAAVRASCAPPPRILVGGQAYRTAPQLWRQVGADSFATSARAGIDAMARLDSLEVSL